MNIFKMLFNSNIQRVLSRTALMHMPNIGANEKVLNVLWNIFNSGKNCVISFKDSRRDGETTNLIAYALSYIQICNKRVIFVVQSVLIAEQLQRTIGNIDFLTFMTPDKFDVAIRGRNDVGLVIVDSQVVNVSKIIEHSKVVPNTQFVISTDETNIRYI